MLRRIIGSSILALTLSATSVLAQDVKMTFPIADALNLSQVKEAVHDDIALYWGNQSHPGVAKDFGIYKTTKRTNGFMKEDDTACAWALASALVSLQDRARQQGGNAVIEIKSNIKNYEESSDSEYSCLVGNIMVNVALKGKVVQLQ